MRYSAQKQFILLFLYLHKVTSKLNKEEFIWFVLREVKSCHGIMAPFHSGMTYMLLKINIIHHRSTIFSFSLLCPEELSFTEETSALGSICYLITAASSHSGMFSEWVSGSPLTELGCDWRRVFWTDLLHQKQMARENKLWFLSLPLLSVLWKEARGMSIQDHAH